MDQAFGFFKHFRPFLYYCYFKRCSLNKFRIDLVDKDVDSDDKNRYGNTRQTEEVDVVDNNNGKHDNIDLTDLTGSLRLVPCTNFRPMLMHQHLR